MRILIAEADDLTTQSLESILTAQRYAVETAQDGDAAWELLELFDYDLVIADVNLPTLDGISLCKQLRSQQYSLPILLMTDSDSGHDKAVGLDAGADDYVVKPCDPEELVARVRALLRRGSKNASPILVWRDLYLDPSTYEIRYHQTPLTLTPKESALLELLMRNPRRVFSCGMILEHLWAYEDAPGEEAVRTHIKCIRQKLKAAGGPSDFIETVYGIGYHLKNIPAPESDTSSETTPHPPTKEQTLLALEGIWQRFQPRMQTQLETIERAITALDQNSLSEKLRRSAEQEAHSLAGALGTFGLPKGSQLARELETQLGKKTSLRPQHAQTMQPLVQQLRQTIQQKSAEPSMVINPGQTPYLLVIDNDQTFLSLLIHEASHWGYQVQMLPALDQAAETVTQHPPAAVILDPDVDAHPTRLKRFIKQLNTAVPTIPVIVLTHQEGLSNRLKIMRLGISRFLQKPMPATQILEAVNQVLQHHHPAAAKIMVMDDDPVVLNTLTALLNPWGFSVTTLDQPQQFLKVLNRVCPDLLILDITMPKISGIELCQVVRNDPRWSTLPIIFLTAHTTPDRVTQVFTVGADDFVSKPVTGPELVVRILNRLERVKLLQRLANVDPLTGVLNRPKSTQDLNVQLNLAMRYEQPFALVLIDLDQLRKVNLNYSHETGDSLLRQLGRRLSQFFRREDIIGRWGGEEFVIGMYGMTAQEAKARLVALTQNLVDHPLLATFEPSIHLSFCAGIAHFPASGNDTHALYKAAEEALQQAKAQGQGSISIATPQPQPVLNA
ncbi:MAG: response regulator [Cyanobacteria bacterium J06635_1]